MLHKHEPEDEGIQTQKILRVSTTIQEFFLKLYYISPSDRHMYVLDSL